MPMGKSIRLTLIYNPKGLKDCPVVMFIHGGTWRSGDRKIYRNIGYVLAKQGIGAVMVSYRLSPAVLRTRHTSRM